MIVQVPLLDKGADPVEFGKFFIAICLQRIEALILNCEYRKITFALHYRRRS